MAGATLEGLLFDESTNEAVRAAVPDIGIRFFELVTHLGDGAVLIAFGTLLYWFGGESNRRTRAIVIAVGLAGFAISVGMKGMFLRPRPELAGGYSGYSFPSAHALGAAAFYGTLASVGTVGTRRLRYVVASVVIALVAASRVVIGVHFVGDVIVGVAIGLALVALVVSVRTPDPEWIFVLAFGIALAGYLLGSREYTTMKIGATLGAAVAWPLVRSRPANPRGAAILVFALLCLPALAAVRLAFGVFPTLSVLEVPAYAIVTGTILATPVLATRLNDWPIVDRLQRWLPFSGRVVDSERMPPR